MRRLLPCVVMALAIAACAESEDGEDTIVNQNPGAVIQVTAASANPNPAVVGDAVGFFLTISAQHTLTAVLLDLTTVGGAANTPMLDDGTGADVTATDGTYSAQLVIPAGQALGVRSLPYLISDSLGFTGSGFINLVVANATPAINLAGSSVENADGTSGPLFGPLEVLELRVDASDADSTPGVLTVTADLSVLGGTATQALAYNGTSGLYELDYACPRGVTPGDIDVVVRAEDASGAFDTETFQVTVQNWTGVDGSATGHGISDSFGWTLGSGCVTDPQGRIYVAFQRRVNLMGGDWTYCVYVRRYDPALDVWSGLGGSDTGFGLNLNSQGRFISSGYFVDIAYYQEANQASNKAAVYVLFHGDPDPDDADNLWDSFLVRYNITDGQWQALGTGSDASDHVPDTFTSGVDDAGGFTKLGRRAQEPAIAFDPATDDVYVAYHAQFASPSTTYAIYLKRFSRTTGVWTDVTDASPADGVSDTTSVNCQMPTMAVANGRIYLAWQVGSSSGSIQMRDHEIATGTFSSIVTVFDAAAPGNAPAVHPKLVRDSQNRLVLSYSVKATGDQRVEVVRAAATGWATPANWVGVGGSKVVSIQPNTNTQNIRTRVALGPNDEIWSCWNQVHAGMTGTMRNIYVRKFDGTAWREVYGSWSQDGISDYPTVTDWLPWICVDPQGRPVVSWDTFWGGGTSNDYRKIYVKTIR